MGLFLEKPLRIFPAGVPGNELQGTRKRVARMSECDMRDSGCSDILAEIPDVASLIRATWLRRCVAHFPEG
jgi:hypothetical protein